MAMTIRIGDWTFDHVDYDREADVLYLSIGEPRPAVGEETPEGHVLRYGEETGELCGLTLIGPRHILEAEGKLRITTPHREELAPDALAVVSRAA